MADSSSPAAISAATFSQTRKGFDPDEVRAYLDQVAHALSQARTERDLALAKLEAARREVEDLQAKPPAPADLDEATVSTLLGQEAARVLTTAREGAASLRARVEGEVEVARLEAERDIARQRADASEETARQRVAAEEEAALIRRNGGETAEQEMESAKTQGREMVLEARAYRERVMADLARRHEAARQQIEVLRLQRARLRSSFSSAEAALSEIRNELADDIPDPDPLEGEVGISGAFPVVAAVTGTSPSSVPSSMAMGELPSSRTASEPSTLDEGDNAFGGDVSHDDPVMTPTAPAHEHELPGGAHADHEIDEAVQVHPTFLDPSPDQDDGQDGAPDPASTPDVTIADTIDPGNVPDVTIGDEPVKDSSIGAPSDEASDNPTDISASVHVDEHRPVDDLFARIRAGRVGDLQEGPAATAVVTAAAAPVGSVALATEPQAGTDVLGARNEVLAPLELSVSRRLKRVLADEQSEVLDQLRRRKAAPSADELLGELPQSTARYQAAVRDDLQTAARAGAQSVASLGAAELAELSSAEDVLGHALNEVEREFVKPLRDHVERGLRAAGESADEAASQLRAVYREWKTQRIEALVGHLVLSAHGRGAFAALVPGTPICWIVDEAARPCAEGDDNALAGATPCGEAFPTGHRSAPAYAGCRCAISPVAR